LAGAYPEAWAGLGAGVVVESVAEVEERTDGTDETTPSFRYGVDRAELVDSGVEPIAIIGASGIMPGAEDLEAFWERLVAGDDLVGEVPAERWDWRAWMGDPLTEKNRTNAKWGGFMKAVDAFDYAFF